ncbi:hypothetical protein D3C81_1347970 [compost metagenome]
MRGPQRQARFVERAQRGFGGFEELAALGGQPHGKRAAVDQRRAGPDLQRLHAPAKRRRRDIAQLGRARQAAGLRQADEVFEPTDVHGGRRAGQAMAHCSVARLADSVRIFPHGHRTARRQAALSRIHDR